MITVCDNSTGTNQVFMVDLANGNAVTKRPIQAEAAIMNPISKVLALRGSSIFSNVPAPFSLLAQPALSYKSSTSNSEPR